MNIFHVLLSAPGFSTKKKGRADALKEHSSENLFRYILLNSLKEEVKTANISRSFPLKKYSNVSLLSLQDYKSTLTNLYSGKLRSISINSPDKLSKQEKKITPDKGLMLRVPLKEKDVFVKYRLARRLYNGKSYIFPVLKAKLRKELLSSSAVKRKEKLPVFTYKPLKRFLPAKLQLKLIKNRSERLFKLDKDHVSLEGAPQNSIHFFGVAPGQIVNHSLVTTVESSKERTSVLKDQKVSFHLKNVTSRKIGTLEPIKILNKFKNGDLERDGFLLKKKDLAKESGYRLSNSKIYFSVYQRSVIDVRSFSTNERLIDVNPPLFAFENGVLVGKLPKLKKSLPFKVSTSFFDRNQNKNFVPVTAPKFYIESESSGSFLRFERKTSFMKAKYRVGINNFAFKSDRKFRIIGDTKSSFPPGKYPALKRAVVDRSFPAPVHLFSVSFENPQPLLSDKGSQFQHRFHSSEINTLHDTSLSTVSFSYLPEHSSDGRSDSSSGFSDGLNHSFHFQDLRGDTDFQVSYVDRNLKLLATVKGKVLNLNLNLLGNMQLDPSTLRDITAVIENSGFIPGKITLKQRKGRYTLSPEEASKKLELKV